MPIYIPWTRESFFNNAVKNPNNNCWLWRGAKEKRSNPHGHTSLYGRGMTAQRAAWILYYGKIKGNKYVLHKCDIGLCINPDHLYLGTAKDNGKDYQRRGRGAIRRIKIKEERIYRQSMRDWRYGNIIDLYNSGEFLMKEIADMFSITISGVSRVIERHGKRLSK